MKSLPILRLYDRLTSVLSSLGQAYEIIFVDDASTDRSFQLLSNLVETDAKLKVIRLRRNFGQTAALAAGFDEASGEVVVSMDGDLQHDPDDLPALLQKIEEGYDIASGWRKNRVDNAVTRRFPSRVANWLMAKASGVDLRDFGTTFKAYRAEILHDINLYGELHRFIPALAAFYGARHRPRSLSEMSPASRAVPTTVWAGRSTSCSTSSQSSSSSAT